MDTSNAPTLSEWLLWPTERVAEWIGDQASPVIMGWPFNGTRRWYLTHQQENPEAEDYLSTVIGQQAELHQMILNHGVRAILAPGLGRINLKRGADYMKYALSGLLRVGSEPTYQRMFEAGVRLRFYGDYAEFLDTPEYRPMLEACEEIMENTAGGDGPVILIGLFADSAQETVTRLGVDFAEQHGRNPTRGELIEAYYGIPLPDLGFFVGFEQPQLFDVPLVTTGLENLYFTLNPSPSLSEQQFREILYDHLVARKAPEVDYDELSEENRERMVRQIKARGNTTLGLGHLDPQTGTWQPAISQMDGFAGQTPPTS
ncbi:MAG: hypothetical protein WA982_09925 [Rubrobacteraceae bacterium]